MALSRVEKEEYIRLAEERIERDARRRLFLYYPDEGPLRRELYPKHLEFFRAGGEYRERCFMAANRVGKSEGAGGYETALHLTGLYPNWWEGRVFDRPTVGLACGKTFETTRDIIQAKLFGNVVYRNGKRTVDGTGLVPGDKIGDMTWRQGVTNLIDTVKIEHRLGGWSVLSLKAFQQGRGSFEGTEKDFVWEDEEPPQDIHSENLIRTGTTNGLVYLTFTPLDGMSDVVVSFLPKGQAINA